MSITSYAELQTAVGNWLHRSDLTSIIPDLVTLGHNRIMRDVRTADMETAFSEAIASGTVAVPSGFLAWKNVYVDGSSAQRLETKPLSWLYLQYPTRTADGKPAFISRNAATFEFGPYPDSAYTVKGTYYKRLAAPATSWNAIATTWPELYLFATLCEAAPYIRDAEMVAAWEGKYSQIVMAINNEDLLAEFSGAPLAMAAA
jgi:hypothetical protein